MVVLGRRGHLAREIARRSDDVRGLERDTADPTSADDAAPRPGWSTSRRSISPSTPAGDDHGPADRAARRHTDPTQGIPVKEFRRLADTDPTGTFSVMSHAVGDAAQ